MVHLKFTLVLALVLFLGLVVCPLPPPTLHVNDWLFDAMDKIDRLMHAHMHRQDTRALRESVQRQLTELDHHLTQQERAKIWRDRDMFASNPAEQRRLAKMYLEIARDHDMFIELRDLSRAVLEPSINPAWLHERYHNLWEIWGGARSRNINQIPSNAFLGGQNVRVRGRM